MALCAELRSFHFIKLGMVMTHGRGEDKEISWEAVVILKLRP